MKDAALNLMDQVIHQFTNNKHLGAHGDPKRVHLVAHFVFAARAMEDALLLVDGNSSSSNGTLDGNSTLAQALQYICNEVHGLCKACEFNLFILASDYRPYLQQYLAMALGIKEGLVLDKCDWPVSHATIQQRGEGGGEETGGREEDEKRQAAKVDTAEAGDSDWGLETRRRGIEIEQKLAHVCKRYEVQGALHLEHDRVWSLFLAVFAFGDDVLNDARSNALTGLLTTHSYTLAETAQPGIHFGLCSELIALFGEGSKGKWKPLTVIPQQHRESTAPFSVVVNVHQQAAEMAFIVSFLRRYPHAIRKAADDEVSTVAQAVLTTDGEGGSALLRRLVHTDSRVLRFCNTNSNCGRLQEVVHLQETVPQIAVEITKEQLEDFLVGIEETVTTTECELMLKDWRGRWCELSDHLFKKFGHRPEMTSTEIVADVQIIAGNSVQVLGGIPDGAQVLDKPKFPQLIELLRTGKVVGAQATDPRFASNLVLETKDILCKHSFSDTELANKSVIILLGQTGSGKSTAGNWLGGKTYSAKMLTNEHGETYLGLELNEDEGIFETSSSLTVC
jgi:hypothetical protein